MIKSKIRCIINDSTYHLLISGHATTFYTHYSLLIFVAWKARKYDRCCSDCFLSGSRWCWTTGGVGESLSWTVLNREEVSAEKLTLKILQVLQILQILQDMYKNANEK